MYGQYIVLFSILFTGYFLRKLNFIDATINNGLSKFIVYFAYPCLIILNLSSLKMNQKLIADFLLMLALSLLLFALHSVWIYYYCKFRKVPGDTAPIMELSSVMPNDGFMGFPFALLFFGKTGFFLMLAHNAAMNFHFYSYGLHVLRRNKRKGKEKNTKTAIRTTLKLLTNPNIIALVTGFILCRTSVVLPAPVEQYLSLIGNVATPMAMIFIGFTLAESNPVTLFREAVVIESSAQKLFFMPVTTFALVMFLPIDPMIKASLVLARSFPTAAAVSMVSQLEGHDQRIAGKILFLSTLLSILTIPLWVKGINTFLIMS